MRARTALTVCAAGIDTLVRIFNELPFAAMRTCVARLVSIVGVVIRLLLEFTRGEAEAARRWDTADPRCCPAHPVRSVVQMCPAGLLAHRCDANRWSSRELSQ